MKGKVYREELSQKASLSPENMCAPPSNIDITKNTCQNESLSLCTLTKGSLTIEAALAVPFFLTILLAFFSFFLQYASAADLKIQAAAEAKKIGIALGGVQNNEDGRVVIYKSAKAEKIWAVPFTIEKKMTEKAVCRGWIGFTELQTKETYVYITPEGSVYHLNRDCTHLNLSVRRVFLKQAGFLKNEYGEKYRECELCEEPFGFMVFITNEGNCYHSQRSCSGLKRTVRQVPISETGGRTVCSRCLSKE